MLNVEFRVSGQLIGYMNIHNEGVFADEEGICRYSYSKVTKQGEKHFTDIYHAQADGMESLVVKCLQHAEDAI